MKHDLRSFAERSAVASPAVHSAAGASWIAGPGGTSLVRISTPASIARSSLVERAVEVFYRSLGLERGEQAEQETVAKIAIGNRTCRRGETIAGFRFGLDKVHILERGWAGRANLLKNGSRQITDLFISGDATDFAMLSSNRAESIIALGAVELFTFDRPRLLAAISAHSRLAVAMLERAYQQQSRLRTWLACQGRHGRIGHLAHLFCELHWRLGGATSCLTPIEFPLTQQQLADFVGLTPVHTNRLLQEMRRDGLVRLEHGLLQLLDPDRLRRIAGFDPSYLA